MYSTDHKIVLRFQMVRLHFRWYDRNEDVQETEATEMQLAY